MTILKSDVSEDYLISLITQLTLNEKVKMLSGELSFFSGMKRLIKDDYYHTYPFSAVKNERLGIPGLRFIDGPRGVVLHGGATTFPVSMARGAAWDPDLEERIGDAIGKELRALGGTLFGGVCINLLRHPAWGRAQETYGEDPVHVGEIGSALVRGVERHAVSCVKHYAANSMENARFQVNINIDDRALHEVYLPHFKDCVDAGARSVMSSYNALNGEWCGQNKVLLRDILKQRWGFRGFVITDFIFGMRDAQKAIESGLDVEMPFSMVWGYKLKKLVRAGKVPETFLDEALRRAIKPQFEMPPQKEYDQAMVGASEHLDLSREAATKSMVLLKNEQSFLPLDKRQKIIVVGRLAADANLGDHGSSDTRPDYVVTPLQGLRSTFVNQVAHFNNAAEDGAEKAIRAADAVIVVAGYTHREEGEFIAPTNTSEFLEQIPVPKYLRWLASVKVFYRLWKWLLGGLLRIVEGQVNDEFENDSSAFGRGGDRSVLTLTDEDEDFIKRVCELNSNTLVSLMSGSAVIMEKWRSLPRAILMMWYPGMEGGNAFADLIVGVKNPSGKLPFVVPKKASHLPEFDIDAHEFTYDLWHGHRMMARDGNLPAFPFGYGLSYSSFSIRSFSCSKQLTTSDSNVSIKIELSNDSLIDGDEIVQVYAKALNSEVERAPLQLVAFKRVSVVANEQKSVDVEFPLKRLAYFDTQLDEFVIEPVKYELSASTHSLDTNALKCELSIT